MGETEGLERDATLLEFTLLPSEQPEGGGAGAEKRRQKPLVLQSSRLQVGSEAPVSACELGNRSGDPSCPSVPHETLGQVK